MSLLILAKPVTLGAKDEALHVGEQLVLHVVTQPIDLGVQHLLSAGAMLLGNRRAVARSSQVPLIGAQFDFGNVDRRCFGRPLERGSHPLAGCLA